MKLLKTVTAAGTIKLENLKPNVPVFLIHQYQSSTGSYPAGTKCLVACRIKEDTTDYAIAAGEVAHYFGCDQTSGSTYHSNQVMMFVPSGTSMSVVFAAANPPTETSRILIFQ